MVIFRKIIFLVFVADFIGDVYLMLNIKEPKKKKRRNYLPINSMLKLFVYAKMGM